MLATVAVVVATHDLALGVVAGVLLSGIFFAGKVRRMFAVERVREADAYGLYRDRADILRFGRSLHRHAGPGKPP